jgi:hypothetical protein
MNTYEHEKVKKFVSCACSFLANFSFRAKPQDDVSSGGFLVPRLKLFHKLGFEFLGFDFLDFLIELFDFRVNPRGDEFAEFFAEGVGIVF